MTRRALVAVGLIGAALVGSLGCRKGQPVVPAGAVLVYHPGHARLGDEGIVGLSPEDMRSRDAVAALYPSFDVSSDQDDGAQPATYIAIEPRPPETSRSIHPIMTITAGDGGLEQITLGAPGIATVHDLQVGDSFEALLARGEHACEYFDDEEPWVQCTVGDATSLYYVMWVGRPAHGDPTGLDQTSGPGLDAWMMKSAPAIDRIVWSPVMDPVDPPESP